MLGDIHIYRERGRMSGSWRIGKKPPQGKLAFTEIHVKPTAI